MSDAVAAESLATLAAGSKSFDFAGRFLPRARRRDAAVLYAFCRLVDDLADEAPSPEVARADLGDLGEELRGRRPPRPLVEAVRHMARRLDMDLGPAEELIRGVRSDLGLVRVPDDRALIRYCYRVAGTVGLMMCPVLGVERPEARPYALDLGVAMQLTNIARDVLEDARMGRVYLPASRLAAAGSSQGALLDGDPAAAPAARRVAQDLLWMAERYYASADRGLWYIPAKPRLAILVASRVYREIGRRILLGRSDPMTGRTVVSGRRKAWVATKALAAFAGPTVLGLRRRAHPSELHTPIRDLPGADVGARLIPATLGGAK